MWNRRLIGSSAKRRRDGKGLSGAMAFIGRGLFMEFPAQFRMTSCTFVAIVISMCVVSQAQAVPLERGVEGPTPDVFYNYWVPPVPAGSAPGVGAQLYVSPRPVPPRVGHTWYTYPPFMPHEFLYQHRRRYVRSCCTTGMHTKVNAYWW